MLRIDLTTVSEVVDSPKAMAVARRYALRLYQQLLSAKPVEQSELGCGFHGVKVGDRLVDIVITSTPGSRGAFIEKPHHTYGPTWFASSDANEGKRSMLVFHCPRINDRMMSFKDVSKGIFVHEVSHLLQNMVGDFDSSHGGTGDEGLNAYANNQVEIDAHANEILTELDLRLRKRKAADPAFVQKVFGNDDKGLERLAKRAMPRLWPEMTPKSRARVLQHLKATRDMHLGAMQAGQKPRFTRIPENEQVQIDWQHDPTDTVKPAGAVPNQHTSETSPEGRVVHTTMAIRDFLYLNPKRGIDDRPSGQWLRDHAAKGGAIAPPMLLIREMPNGRLVVTGHEGRGRAMLAAELGHTHVPVALRFSVTRNKNRKGSYVEVEPDEEAGNIVHRKVRINLPVQAVESEGPEMAPPDISQSNAQAPGTPPQAPQEVVEVAIGDGRVALCKLTGKPGQRVVTIDGVEYGTMSYHGKGKGFSWRSSMSHRHVWNDISGRANTRLGCVQGLLRVAERIAKMKAMDDEAKAKEDAEKAQTKAARAEPKPTGKADPTTNPKFMAWFQGSVVADKKGTPVRVYRGHHGEAGQTYLSSLSFTDDPDISSIYAAKPDSYGYGTFVDGSRNSAFYLSIKKPVYLNNVLSSMADVAKAMPGITPEELKAIEQTIGKRSTQYKVVNKGGVRHFDTFAIIDTQAFVKAVQRLGFDGIIHKDVFQGGKRNAKSLLGKEQDHLRLGRGDTHVTYRPLSMTQVKSAWGNKGDFDPAKPEVTEAIVESDDDHPAHDTHLHVDDFDLYVSEYGINSVNWLLTLKGEKMGEGHLAHNWTTGELWVRSANLAPEVRGKGLYRKILRMLSASYGAPIASDESLTDKARSSWRNDPQASYDEERDRYVLPKQKPQQ